MTDQLPAPSPSGYQPSPGEGLREVTVEVFPSWGYQKVSLQGTVVFPEPRSYSEALPAIEDAYQALEENAREKVDRLIAIKEEYEQRARSQPATGGPAAATQPATSQAAPSPAPQPQVTPQQAHANVTQQLGGQEIGGQTAGGLQWAVGQKPNNRGSFKYITTASVSTDQFREQANQAIAGLGVDVSQVTVFDDRTGNYGLEGGNTTYSAGKAKAGKDTQLKQMLGNRDIVAYLDFKDDGTVEATLTKDAKSAVQAIQMMQRAGGQQPQAQPQAPHPADNPDVPF